MDIRNIRYFLAVAEEKSVSAAAKKLHISQPPLSRQIKDLEEELGVSLFNREISGLTLTEAGVLLKGRGEELLAVYEGTLREMQEFAAAGRNRIVFGAACGANVLVVPIYERLFRQKFERAEITSVSGTVEEITAKVMREEVDIGFVRLPFERMDLFDIVKLNDNERWLALTAPHYPSADDWQDDVSISQLIDKPLILPARQSLYMPLLDEMKPLEENPQVLCYYFEMDNAVLLAQHRLGIAIVPESILRIVPEGEYIARRIRDLKLETCYAAIKKKGEHSSEAVRKFWPSFQHHKLGF